MFLLNLIFFNANGANISNYMQTSSCLLSAVQVNGPILVGDAIKVLENMNLLKNKFGEIQCTEGQTYLIINSDGGDIDDACANGDDDGDHGDGGANGDDRQ